MVKCRQCGNEFEEQFGVCPKCGTVYEAEEKLPEIKPPADTLPELKDYSDEKSAGKKKPKTKLFVIIGIIAAVVIIGIIAGIIIAASDKGGTSEFDDQISLGEKYLSEENYEEAIAAFRKAIEIDPNDPEGYIRLADVYIAMGNSDEAIKVLEEGLENTGSDEIKSKLDSLRNGDFSEDSEPEESETEESTAEEVRNEESKSNIPDTPEISFEAEENKGEIWITKFIGKETEVVIPSFIEGKPVTVIAEHAFSGCASITSILIPNTVKSIGRSSFGMCKSLSSIAIPDSLTIIGDFAFYDCTGLTGITIPDSVTRIGESAFLGCTNLTSITIPESVTSVGARAFYSWTSSQTIYIKGRNSAPSDWNKDWKGYCKAKIVWNAEADDTSKPETSKPETSKEESSTPEYTLGTIIASGNCGDNVNWQLDDKGLLVISGEGNMYDFVYYTYERNAWNNSKEKVKTVIIEKNVTNIGDSAFASCKGLKNITIPESVTSIGGSAFFGCEILNNITIPNSVTIIGSSAFASCTSLTSITIPDSVTGIGDLAFLGWTSSQTIYIEGRSSAPSGWDENWNEYCNAKIVWNA